MQEESWEAQFFSAQEQKSTILDEGPTKELSLRFSC